MLARSTDILKAQAGQTLYALEIGKIGFRLAAKVGNDVVEGSHTLDDGVLDRSGDRVALFCYGRIVQLTRVAQTISSRGMKISCAKRLSPVLLVSSA